MSIEELRTGAAWASVYLAFLVFVGYAFYGVYVDLKLQSFRRGNELPRNPDEWRVEHFKAGAEPWLVRLRRLRKRGNWIWIGSIVGGNLLYFLLMPS